MRILITGATGQIGGAVLATLLKLRNKAEESFEIQAGFPERERTSEIAKLGVQTVHLDYQDLETCSLAMRGVDHAFIVLPISLDVAHYARSLIEAAKQEHVKSLVAISEWDVATLGQFCQYFAEHQIVEQIYDSCGIPMTRLRPTNCMQNLISIYHVDKSVQQTGTMNLAYGDGVISYVDARDVAEAACICLLNPEAHVGRDYVLTGVATHMSEVAKSLQEAIGTKVTYVPLSLDMFRESLLNAGLPNWLVDLAAFVNARQAESQYSKIFPDLELLIGHSPRSWHQFFVDYSHHFNVDQKD